MTYRPKWYCQKNELSALRSRPQSDSYGKQNAEEPVVHGSAIPEQHEDAGTERESSLGKGPALSAPNAAGQMPESVRTGAGSLEVVSRKVEAAPNVKSPATTSVPAAPTWIPCSERLPTREDADANGDVLFWREGVTCAYHRYYGSVMNHENQAYPLSNAQWMTPPAVPTDDWKEKDNGN